jgi:hypothetical protein
VVINPCRMRKFLHSSDSRTAFKTTEANRMADVDERLAAILSHESGD